MLSLVTRIAWISSPDVLLFDENYYVNAARKMIGVPIPSDQIYANSPSGIDPNVAHPPLGKLLIAMGIRAFGNQPLGWRFASLLFGSYAILALYWLARSAGFNPWVALGASTLMAADTMFFTHGRIGTLEILVLTFMLAASAAYLNKSPLLAGVILGLGACVKLVGFFPLVALGIFEMVQVLLAVSNSQLPEQPKNDSLRAEVLKRLPTLGMITATAIVTYLGSLWVLDSRYTNFDNPVEHTKAMFTSFADTGLDNSIIDMPRPQARGESPDAARFTLAVADMAAVTDRQIFSSHLLQAQNGPQPLIRQRGQDLYLAPQSSPWEWMLNRKSISYYRSPNTGGEARSWSHFGLWTSDGIHFQALVNPAIIGFAIPALIYAGRLGWTRRRTTYWFPLAWFAGTFGCYLAIYLVRPNSTGHIYYILGVMPAIYVVIAQLFSSAVLAIKFRSYYAIAVAIGFIWYFPFKTWGGG